MSPPLFAEGSSPNHAVEVGTRGRFSLELRGPSTSTHPCRCTLRQEYATSLADRRIRLIPAAGFAGLAVALSLVGLGGLLARAVTERRRELAIRTVLGASPAGASQPGAQLASSRSSCCDRVGCVSTSGWRLEPTVPVATVLVARLDAALPAG